MTHRARIMLEMARKSGRPTTEASVDPNLPSTSGISISRSPKKLTPQLETQSETSDSDFSPVASDYIPSVQQGSSTENEGTVGKRSKKIKSVGPKRLQRKRCRASGKTYTTAKGVVKVAKSMQPDPCATSKGCYNECSKNFQEGEREAIFKTYWHLDTFAQRNWLLSNTNEVGIKRPKPGASSRVKNYVYQFPKDGKKLKVCKKFFLATLAVSPKLLRYTLENVLEHRVAKPDQRGRHEPSNKTSDDIKKFIENFIQSLPAVPSHYCRQNTKKKYLPAEIANRRRLFMLFEEHCESSGKACEVSERVFRNIFNKEYNIGFHLPKKDKCNSCEKFKFVAQPSELEIQKQEEHKKEVAVTKSYFEKEQQRHETDPGFRCATFDLQKVLNTPYGDSMMLFYSRKYAFYNETVYESGTREGYCFLWGENDGNRGANEVCTVIHKYCQLVEDGGLTTHLSLFCDSCPGQNKNWQMIAMLYYVLSHAKNLKNIDLTFLIPGHTYMPVDSVHSTIERVVRKKIIWAPSEWPTVIKMARHTPKAYNVESLTYKNFKDYKVVQEAVFPKKVIHTVCGKKILFSKIRQFSIHKNDEDAVVVDFRYSLEDKQLLRIPIHKKAAERMTAPREGLYKKELGIAPQKYKDLETLCSKGVIPEIYRKQYLDMPQKPGKRDCLPQTDEEDERTDY